MRRILTIILACFWAFFFGIMAVAALGYSEAAAGTPFEAAKNLILAASAPISNEPSIASGFAFGFSLVSVLFIWAAITSVSDNFSGRADADDVGRLAYATAIALFAICLLSAILFPATGKIPDVMVHLAALAASYVAAVADGSTSVREPDNEKTERDAARHFALGAAHTSLLSRLSQREDTSPERL